MSPHQRCSNENHNGNDVSKDTKYGTNNGTPGSSNGGYLSNNDLCSILKVYLKIKPWKINTLWISLNLTWLSKNHLILAHFPILNMRKKNLLIHFSATIEKNYIFLLVISLSQIVNVISETCRSAYQEMF